MHAGGFESKKWRFFTPESAACDLSQCSLTILIMSSDRSCTPVTSLVVGAFRFHGVPAICAARASVRPKHKAREVRRQPHTCMPMLHTLYNWPARIAGVHAVLAPPARLSDCVSCAKPALNFEPCLVRRWIVV